MHSLPPSMLGFSDYGYDHPENIPVTASNRETITHLEICVGIEKRTHASTIKSCHVSFKPLVEIGVQRMFRGIPNKNFALFQEYH